MTLKDLVFSMRQQLKTRLGSSPAVSHTYEMLAALLGYDSYAALATQSFIVGIGNGILEIDEDAKHPFEFTHSIPHAYDRHQAIGARGDGHAISLILEEVARDRRLVTIPHKTLIEYFANDPHLNKNRARAIRSWMEYLIEADADDLALPVSMLEEACLRNADLHYPLGQIYLAISLNDPDPADYRLFQLGSGLTLTEAATTSSAEPQHYENALKRFLHHNHLAAASGNENAMLDSMLVASDSGDEDSALSYLSRLHETEIREIIEMVAEWVIRREITGECQHWARKAAAYGHIESLRWLVEQSEHAPTIETWTWIYLSRLLGSDVTAENLRAYHDGGQGDGQEYDDDMGGAMYVDGDFALQVSPLSEVDDEAAQLEAKRLMSQLESGGASFN